MELPRKARSGHERYILPFRVLSGVLGVLTLERDGCAYLPVRCYHCLLLLNLRPFVAERDGAVEDRSACGAIFVDAEIA